MKENIMTIGDMQWMHLTSPTEAEVQELSDYYDFHDIIIEDMLETATQDKIDIYDDHLFMIIHFPKYIKEKQKYVFNELSIILGKTFLVTIVNSETKIVRKIKADYQDEMAKSSEEDYKTSPYYVLYKLLDGMYDKVLKSLVRFNSDITVLEEKMFDNESIPKDLLENLMIKRRNAIFLRHAFSPHGEIITELQKSALKFFKGELDVYFEDMQYKIDKVTSHVSVIYQHTGSLSDTYNTLMNMKTNTVVGVLAIFTAIVGTMTFITGLYGMNVLLPFQDYPFAFMVVVVLIIVLATTMIIVFKKKRRI